MCYLASVLKTYLSPLLCCCCQAKRWVACEGGIWSLFLLPSTRGNFRAKAFIFICRRLAGNDKSGRYCPKGCPLGESQPSGVTPLIHVWHPPQTKPCDNLFWLLSSASGRWREWSLAEGSTQDLVLALCRDRFLATCFLVAFNPSPDFQTKKKWGGEEANTQFKLKQIYLFQ